MPMQYKIDMVAALIEAGYYPQQIRREKLFSEYTMTQFRQKMPVSWKNIETLCCLPECRPGDLLEYVPGDSGE